MAKQKNGDIYRHPTAMQMRASVDDALGVADMRCPATVLMENEPEDDLKDGEIREDVMRLACSLKERNILAAAGELQRHIDESRKRSRLVTLNGLLRYVWSESRNPWAAMCYLLAITRLVAPEIVRGMSQTEVAVLLHGSPKKRAAISAREKKIEGFMRSWGVKGFTLLGGRKSASTTPVYAAAQEGNNSRRKGERRKKGREFLAKKNTKQQTL